MRSSGLTLRGPGADRCLPRLFPIRRRSGSNSLSDTRKIYICVIYRIIRFTACIVVVYPISKNGPFYLYSCAHASDGKLGKLLNVPVEYCHVTNDRPRAPVDRRDEFFEHDLFPGREDTDRAVREVHYFSPDREPRRDSLDAAPEAYILHLAGNMDLDCLHESFTRQWGIPRFQRTRR